MRSTPCALLTALALAVLTACGDDAAQPPAQTATTTAPTTSAQATSTTAPTTSTSAKGVDTTRTTTPAGAERTTGSPDEGVDWRGVLPGVWIVPLPQGGDEVWSFNDHTDTATILHRPDGADPAGGAAPDGHPYLVDGDTLTVVTDAGRRVYTGLTPSDGHCFAAEHGGHTLQFCPHAG